MKQYHSQRIMKISERIELFDSIRDVPFCLMGKNAFYCFSKNNLLRKKLAIGGIESVLMQGWFKWSELAIPQEAKKLIRKDKQKHVFLKVFIPEKNEWVYIDPTWDKALENVFPIAEWNGVDETVLMTKLSKISEYEKRNILARIISKMERRFYPEGNNKFYHWLDKWMDEKRTKQT
ncbi:MAG: hypothetical protein ACD_9C00029G0005 [uncultured bacterium]|nr:MAG: hypothetical protein ACD_9C00029G0005 [uncultured bacterium]